MNLKILEAKENFLGIEEPEYYSLHNAKVAVLPVPYEHTVSYGGGTRNGPRALLDASRYVEFYDEETKREVFRELGITTIEPVACDNHGDEEVLENIYKTVGELVRLNKFVVMVGGEHTITQAAVAAYAERYNDLSILHFDAHSDLRSEYQGSKFSHASVMARVCEFIDPHRLVQVGIRAQCIEEYDFIEQRGITTLYAHEIRSGKYTKLLKYWEDYPIEKLTDHVYVTFDVDAFDPSIMPATGTPEPNGLNWSETVALLRKLGRRKKVVGCDVVELAPIAGLHHADMTAAKLVSKMINYFVR
jgi:agmatinase